MPLPAREADGALVFDALVAPRASRVRLGPVTGDRVKIAVTAPPVDGEANAAVVDAVAAALGVPRRAVSITAGLASRRKTVRVEGATLAMLEAALGA
jgi:uncharacterized protein (TIGR00251 family)